MRILALETTDPVGSVAAFDGCNLLSELMLDKSLRSAAALAPAMQSLLKQVEWLPNDVQLVGVSVGPGSFTGIRIGVSTAKVFAYCVGADVLAVNTLEAIAAGSGPAPCAVGDGQRRVPITEVAIDAQRGDVVVQCFLGDSPDSLQPEGPQELMAAEVWLARLAPGTRTRFSALTLCSSPDLSFRAIARAHFGLR